METITIKPRNKKELVLITSIMQHLSIPTSLSEKNSSAKKKAKEVFLQSLEDRLNQVQQHIDGEIHLKDARDLLNEI